MAINDPPLLRTSERGAFKKCEWSWDIEFNLRLRPSGPSAPALRFGSLVHASLEKFYRPGLKRGPRPYRTFRKLYDEEVKDVWDKFRIKVDDEWNDAGELGEAMLKNYWDLYGKDEEYEVLATEHAFQLPIRSSKGTILFYYVGTLDGVWKHRPTKKVLICDHKTAKSIDQLVASLPQDDQAGAYWTFGVEWLYENGVLKPNQKLHGMLYNILRKADKDDRPKNALGQYLNQPTKEDLLAFYEGIGRELPAKTSLAILKDDLSSAKVDVAQLGQVSKVQPPDLFRRHKEWRSEGNRIVQRQRTKAEMRRMKRIRRGAEPPLKAPSFGHCGGCPVRGVCELHEAGADYEGMLKSSFGTWDPYSAHEIAEAR